MASPGKYQSAVPPSSNKPELSRSTASHQLNNPTITIPIEQPKSLPEAALKTGGIEHLKAPGADSNYIDWSFVVGIHLQSTRVSHVLTPVNVTLQPDSWAQDNTAVCAVITRTINPINYCYIRDFENDAAKMWAALQKAHQDSTSGGCMYWLRKLVKARMTGSDVDSHINEMAMYAERLNALITVDNPLTADNVHSTALLMLLPVDWLHCVLSLMNEEQVLSVRIVAALKAESLRRKTRGKGDAVNPIAVARIDTNTPTTAATTTTKKLFCTFCKQPNHDLSNCNNVSTILKKHKEERHQEYLAKQKSSASSSKQNKSAKTKPPARAGHTTVVELDNVLSSSDELQESDYEVSGAAAVALLLSRMSESRVTDFNLDSGCSISMTPFLSSLSSPAVNSTPVCLANSTLV
jgi:hypothetical protein